MLKLSPMDAPLVCLADGSVHVVDTDVSLEDIVSDFEDGAIADEIVFRHENLTLSKVFLVLAFYLEHRKEVEHYLATKPARARKPPKTPSNAA